MKKFLALSTAFAALALALAACGGGSSSSTAPGTTAPAAGGGGGGGGGGGATVSVSADPSGALKFEQATLQASAGKDTFDFTNDSPVEHDFCIESSSGAQLGCSDPVTGGSSTLTATLQPGTYTFYCSIDGHRQAGMEGKLIVK